MERASRDATRQTQDRGPSVSRRISKAVLPADIIERAREELRKRLALPRGDGKRRRRLEQRRERLSQLFAWGDLTEAEYRRQKAEAERDLTLLPDDDKLVLFDRHRKIMVSMAENVAAATLEQLRELILMLVERAETRDRGLGPVRWTGPARPFFAVVAVAPPDGLRHPAATRRSRLLPRGRVVAVTGIQP